jgi:hypothetical protein
MRDRLAILLTVLAEAPALIVAAQPAPASRGDDPVRSGAYPPSPVIAGLTLDWSTHQRHALGSDNWQLTWADDDHLYGAWGDGGGFGGSNDDGRVGLGFARIEDQWFTGRDNGKPTWGLLSAEKPVFENAAGTGRCLSVSFNHGLGRYLLATEHTVSHASVLGFWDAPEPWRPWTTVRLWSPEDRFGQTRPGSTLDWNDNIFFCAFVPKWFSVDGLSFILAFTGGGNGKDNDSLNTVRGNFERRDPPPRTPRGD